jgi:histidinol-phosphate aminotransferase
MTPFPREDYQALTRYSPDRRVVAIDLSDNTNLWGTHPGALARIREVATDDLARYPELYADILGAAVSRRFGVDKSCVTTGCGSDDVLDSAFRAAAGPAVANVEAGDTVGSTQPAVSFAAPTFSMIEPLARMNGMKTLPVLWPDALEDPERLFEGSPSLVYVCRPNNPTGELAPLAWVERVLDLAGPDGPLVIIDEAYADFAGETLIGRTPQHPRLLVTRTTSKAYGLAGLRVGFGVACPEVALEVEKSRGPYKVARLAAEAAAAALVDADSWMEGTVAECISNRARLTDELAARDLPPLTSSANFLLFRSLSGSAADDALRLREEGVAVRPFTGIPDMGDGLRVTVGPWPLMERFLEALDRVVAA